MTTRHIYRATLNASLLFASMACGPTFTKIDPVATKPGEIIIVTKGTKRTDTIATLINDTQQLKGHVRYVEKLWHSPGHEGVIAKLSVPRGSAVDSIIETLKKLPFIQSAQANYYSTLTSADRPSTIDYTPSDSGYVNNQASIFKLTSIPSAWTLLFNRWPSLDDPNRIIKNPVNDIYIGVAVLDSGVASYHPDLKSKLFTNLAESEGKPGVDDDNNGYVDDISGISVNPRDNSSLDENPCDGENNEALDGDALEACYNTVGHGTHVAGIIGAEIDDRDGSMAGICPNCYILPIKITDHTGLIPDDFIIKGIDYIASINRRTSRHHIQIANLSIGKTVNAMAIENAIHRISSEVLVVAAASNDDTDKPSFPAALDNVLSVSAIGGTSPVHAYEFLHQETDEKRENYEQKAIFSNFGNHIDIVAPGMGIWSTAAYAFDPDIAMSLRCAQGNRYCYKNGTSQAAPFVAGIAGLVWTYFFDTLIDNVGNRSTLTNSQVVRKILLMSADRRIYCSGYNHMYMGQFDGPISDCLNQLGNVATNPNLGAGIVDANRALTYTSIENGSIEDKHQPVAKDDRRYDSRCIFVDYQGPRPGFGDGLGSALLMLITGIFGCFFLRIRE